MILALLTIWMLRFVSTVGLVCVALVLTVAACVGVIAAGIIRTWNPERGEQCHQAAVILIDGAIGMATLAEGRRYRTSNVR